MKKLEYFLFKNAMAISILSNFSPPTYLLFTAFYVLCI